MFTVEMRLSTVAMMRKLADLLPEFPATSEAVTVRVCVPNDWERRLIGWPLVTAVLSSIAVGSVSKVDTLSVAEKLIVKLSECR